MLRIFGFISPNIPAPKRKIIQAFIRYATHYNSHGLKYWKKIRPRSTSDLGLWLNPFIVYIIFFIFIIFFSIFIKLSSIMGIPALGSFLVLPMPFISIIISLSICDMAFCMPLS